jgi:ArsR family transcriptional regulator
MTTPALNPTPAEEMTALPASAALAALPVLPTLPTPRLDLPAPDVADAVAMAALLSDRVRAGSLRLLADGPHCVCELAAALGERENNVSNHLAKLREAGLVRASRHEANGRFLYYERDEVAIARARAAIDDILR